MKRNMIFYSMAVLQFVTFWASAQNVTFTKLWERVYGGVDADGIAQGRSIYLDKDSNIIILGSSASGISGNKTSPNCIGILPLNADIWVIKLGQNGNKIFDKAYGSKRDEGALDGHLNIDGSLILAGPTSSGMECDKFTGHFGNFLENDIWIIKIDSNGNRVWDKNYGTYSEESFNSLVNTPDSGYIIAGHGYTGAVGGNISATGNGNADILVFKINANGNKVWNKLYGGNGADFPGSIIKTSNNNYLIAGSTFTSVASGDISTNNLGGITSTNLDNWIIKIDGSGSLLWEKRYGCAEADYGGVTFENTKGQYIIAGNVTGNCLGGDCTDTLIRGSGDIWIFALDSSNGTILYDKRIGGNKYDGVHQIIETTDGGYLLVCNSNSDAGFDKSEPRLDPTGVPFAPMNDIWLIKTDSLFNIEWDKTIGGFNQDDSPYMLMLTDSTFILACVSSSGIGGDKTIACFDTAGGAGYDIWVMKYTIGNATGINELSQPTFSIYPNPVKDVLYVSLRKIINQNSSIIIVDIQGRVIREEKISQNNSSVIPVNVSTLTQGVYLLKLNGQVQRFVKL